MPTKKGIMFETIHLDKILETLKEAKDFIDNLEIIKN